MVYHVIKGTYDFGDGEKMIMDSLLYVSDEKEEWKYDRNDMKQGYIMSYVYNETYPDLSEFGTVGVVPINGGLSRNDQGYDFEKDFQKKAYNYKDNFYFKNYESDRTDDFEIEM